MLQKRHFYFAASLLFGSVFVSRAHSEIIAFLFALEVDVESMVADGAVLMRTDKVGNRAVRSYRLAGHTLICAAMGSGQVESAVSCEAILARRSVDAVITTGVVGALDGTCAVGDVVIVKEIVAWQAGSHGVDGWTETPRSRPSIVPWRAGAVAGARAGVASGDAFIANDLERARLCSVTGMPLVDMNLVGIQAAVNSHGAPALHLRIVSDHAGSGAPEEFRAFVQGYRGELGRRVAELIKTLPVDEESPLARPIFRRVAPEK